MRPLATTLALVFVLALTAEAQYPLGPLVVPPECQWGKSWPGYDARKCGPEKNEQQAATVDSTWFNSRYCVTDDTSKPICLFDDMDSCMKTAERMQPKATCLPNTQYKPTGKK